MLRVLSVLLCFSLVVVSREASADLTAFIGANHTPSIRTVSGVALGVSLLLVGFEFEYSDSRQDSSTDTPTLRSGMFNIQLQTPRIHGLQFYGTAGGGLYQERLLEHRETSLGANAGGGVKLSVVGPIGIRFDYRLFRLSGNPLHANPQRFYVGFNLEF